MSREKGLVSFSAMYEPQVAAALDARMVVATLSDLTSSTIWEANDGNNYTYAGMIVSVYSDSTSDNNGIYRLKSQPYTNQSNWEKIGAEGQSSNNSIEINYTQDEPTGFYQSGDKFIITGKEHKDVNFSSGANFFTVNNAGIAGFLQHISIGDVVRVLASDESSNKLYTVTSIVDLGDHTDFEVSENFDFDGQGSLFFSKSYYRSYYGSFAVPNINEIIVYGADLTSILNFGETIFLYAYNSGNTGFSVISDIQLINAGQDTLITIVDNDLSIPDSIDFILYGMIQFGNRLNNYVEFNGINFSFTEESQNTTAAVISNPNESYLFTGTYWEKFSSAIIVDWSNITNNPISLSAEVRPKSENITNNGTVYKKLVYANSQAAIFGGETRFANVDNDPFNAESYSFNPTGEVFSDFQDAVGFNNMFYLTRYDLSTGFSQFYSNSSPYSFNLITDPNINYDFVRTLRVSNGRMLFFNFDYDNINMQLIAGRICYTVDGNTWIASPSDLLGISGTSAEIVDIAYDPTKNRIYVVGNNGSGRVLYQTSDDNGATWIDRSNITSFARPYDSIAVNPITHVVIAKATWGNIDYLGEYGEDQFVWTNSPFQNDTPSVNPLKVQYLDNYFYLICDNSKIGVSEDGLLWKRGISSLQNHIVSNSVIPYIYCNIEKFPNGYNYILGNADDGGGNIRTEVGNIRLIVENTGIASHKDLAERDSSGNHEKLSPLSDSRTSIQVTNSAGNAVIFNVDTSLGAVTVGSNLQSVYLSSISNPGFTVYDEGAYGGRIRIENNATGGHSRLEFSDPSMPTNMQAIDFISYDDGFHMRSLVDGWGSVRKEWVVFRDDSITWNDQTYFQPNMDFIFRGDVLLRAVTNSDKAFRIAKEDDTTIFSINTSNGSIRANARIGIFSDSDSTSIVKIADTRTDFSIPRYMISAYSAQSSNSNGFRYVEEHTTFGSGKIVLAVQQGDAVSDSAFGSRSFYGPVVLDKASNPLAYLMFTTAHSTNFGCSATIATKDTSGAIAPSLEIQPTNIKIRKQIRPFADGTTALQLAKLDGTAILTVDTANQKVGIGTDSPKSLLHVNGGIKCANDSDSASADKVGTLRYRTSGNNSYCDMCMQTGAAVYSWVNIKTNSW